MLHQDTLRVGGYSEEGRKNFDEIFSKDKTDNTEKKEKQKQNNPTT